MPPTIVEVHKELPKSLHVGGNTSLKKLKHHLAGFDVVVKERTTPTAITEGSWGFEHIKACFRDEIILFVKALKDLFNTFNQYLVDELLEVQNVFHQMEQAVEQHRLESKTFKVKMNQVLNENERLLEQVLSKGIVNIIVNSSVNNVSVNVHECEKCLQLETELQTDFIKKEIYDKLDNPVSNQSAPSFDQLFKLNELKAQSQEKDIGDKAYCWYAKLVQELLTNISKTRPSINNADGKLVVVTLKNKDKRVRFTKPVTSSGNTITKTTSTSNLVSNKPMLSSTGVKPSTSASGSQPLGNTKKDKIQQTPSSTQKNKVEAHPRKVKSSLKNKDCVAEPKRTAHVQHSKLNVNAKLKCVKCNGCMLYDNHDLCVLDFINNVNARNKSKSIKQSSKRQVWKPKGKVLKSVSANKKEPNKSWGSKVSDVPSSCLDECKSSKLFSGIWTPAAPRLWTGVSLLAHQLRNKFVEFRLGHNLFSVGQLAHSAYIKHTQEHTTVLRNLEGVDLLTGYRGNNLYTLSLGDMTMSSLICLLSKASKTKSWLWHRHLSHLNFGLINHLAKHEAVATACYTQNRSIVRLRHGKTPYQLLHDKPLDLSFFHVFGSLCYLTNDSENLGKLQPKADIDFDELTAIASEHSSSGPALHEMTPAIISLGLVPNPPPSTPFVPPLRTDWDILFQSMFDELLTPPPSVDLPAPEVISLIDEVVAPVLTVSSGSPSSTTVDQDAPSPIAHMGNGLYFGIPIPEVPSDQSSSTDSIHRIVHPDHQISEHNSKWTKVHPLENIIGELARLVSTRLQLHEQALFCYYNAFLIVVEPKTYKDALTQSYWIKVMQEELNEFECLKV
ncbi:retrovirus-related pol polyprotein from transposon TNT 1-94 [Tanacetum coccineum]